MCGLSGFIGVTADKETKLMLILGLADGIDNRGGHACGYVSVDDNGELRYARKSGLWVRSRLRFIEGAVGEVTMMHARYATCGRRDDPDNAHPFAIRRNGKVVLWGAHNGMVPDAWDSAKKNGRSIDVDSQEIFELLADRDFEGIQKMSGYGTITWVDAERRNYVNMARLSTQSDFVVVSVKGGGFVWASTKKILDAALEFAGLEVDKEFIVDEPGRVYRIYANKIVKTNICGLRVSGYTRFKGNYSYTTYSSNNSVSNNSKTSDEKKTEKEEEDSEVESKGYNESSFVGYGGNYNFRDWYGSD